MTLPKKDAPNNFPREGEHTPVTRDAVSKLERERPKFNSERHYTIGGEVETRVHSNANAEREAAITNGARRLNQATERVRTGFNAAKPDARTEYIRIQLQAARNHPARNVSREKSPSR
ncbi:MAG: hypothetical protein AAGG56_05575 [Pseudomonadota bacterium]